MEDSVSLESSLSSFWVVPPPESKPHEYGKPMQMTYSVIHDQFLSQDALNEMVIYNNVNKWNYYYVY